MVMEINDQNFEPSTQTKRFWLYVRKPGFSIDGTPFPGLFEITGYTKDKYTFCFALALEIWSMLMILSVGTIPVLYQIALVATAIFVDVALATYFHLYAGKILLRENEAIAATARYTPPLAKAEQAKCASDIKIYHRLRLIPAALIVAFAVCKCVIYILLQREANILTVSVVVAYILVAVIHLNNTGYWLYACLGNFFLWLDRRKFQNIQNEAQKADVTAVTHHYEYIYTDLELVPARFPDSREEHPAPEVIGIARGLPKATKTDKANPDYTLFTWGIFTDQQLQAISHAQRVTNKKLLVASHGVNQQLNILTTKPAVPQGGTSEPVRAV